MSEHQEDSVAVSEQLQSQQHHQQQNEEDQLTLRALVSTREAGVIIGKGGKNVAELRDATGVKAGVSKVVQGVHDRVLTVSGTLEGVAMAYSLIARTMIDNPVAANTMDGTISQDASDSASNAATATNTITTLRLLISHNLMGTVIGRQGAKIKHIQDNSGVRMTASKTLLPQSTERVVEVRGTVEAILQAISEIGACLIEDKDRAYGTILYNPTKVTTVNDRRTSFTRTGNGSDFNQAELSASSSLSQPSRRTSYQPPSHSQQPPLNADVRTQQISIPSDMVGCIIGKGGSKISEIRRLSGSHISIAKTPHDDSGERMFTIQGTMESNERALYLLYGQLENEKERRLQGVILQQQQQQQQDDVLLEEEE